MENHSWQSLRTRIFGVIQPFASIYDWVVLSRVKDTTSPDLVGAPAARLRRLGCRLGVVDDPLQMAVVDGLYEVMIEAGGARALAIFVAAPASLGD